jgi:pyrroline-5-carboxylate reductase
MTPEEIGKSGMVLLGCGKMGGAMLEGWLARGVEPGSVLVIDPGAPDWLAERGVRVNDDLPDSAGIVVLAVKPQIMADAIGQVAPLGRGETVFLSVAAGTTIAWLEDQLGAETPIVRAMPNTPAAIGRGITAITGNDAAGTKALDMAEALLKAVGKVARVAEEEQMDAVTAVSGSGPAYVFHLIEAMADAGAELGLPRDLALTLALETVAGAGALAQEADEKPGQLRENVTSPGGTTAAALNVLMDEDRGFRPLLLEAMRAAAERGRELGK